jgi:hypothetical protein
MPRLRRFPDYRFVGRRDQMVAFDCDDPDQFAQLQAAVEEGGLDLKNRLQSFAPDTLAEARNRGFRSAASAS